MLQNLQNQLQQRADRIVAALHRKSQERLTLMVIPHNHERIFSLHLNWLMILFLTGTISLVVIMAGYTYYHRKVKEREVQHLKTMFGVNYNQANLLHDRTQQTLELHEQLFENLNEIAGIIGIPGEELEILSDSFDTERRAEDILYDEIVNRVDVAPGTNYLPSVYTIKSNYFLLDDRYPLLKSVHEFLHDGLGVYSEMPVGRPFKDFANLRDSSRFGLRLDPVLRSQLEFHTGLDTSGPLGTPVYATAPGYVSRVTYNDPGYGNSVTLQHDFGYTSLYAHFSRVQVRTGQKIQRGQLVGFMGHSGRVTGDHLHYEVKQDGKQVDPLPYVCSVDLGTTTCRKFNNGEDT